MSSPDRHRSFFATTTGVVTGVAGLVTAVVGLLTVGVQLGWWGSDDDGGGGDGTRATSTAPAVTGSTTAAAVAEFTVEPARVNLSSLGPREQVVTVTNRSATVPISLRAPSLSGRDPSSFTATDLSCSGRLDPGRKCDVRVTLSATRAGEHTARLVLQPQSGPAREVDVVGQVLL